MKAIPVALLLLAVACRQAPPSALVGKWKGVARGSSGICRVFAEDIEFQKEGVFIVPDGRGAFRMEGASRVRLYHTTQIVWDFQVSGDNLTLALVSGLEKEINGARCLYQRAN